MSTPSSPSSLYDRVAVALSAFCILHCLALPILAISLPFLSAMAEAEWVHWALAVLAVAASSMVALSGPNARVPGFLIPAGFGSAFIVGALFVEPYGLDEAIPTVIGGVLLATAHLRRLF